MDEIVQQYRKVLSAATKERHAEKCLICGRSDVPFCNSHSVPRCYLKHITLNGKVYYSTVITDIFPDLQIFDVEDGINRSGTFRQVCRKCDGLYFTEYEDPQKIIRLPNNKMLTEIELKCELHYIEKKCKEFGVNRLMGDFAPGGKYYNIDLMEAQARAKKLIKRIGKKNYIDYNLFFWEKLDYVVPLACQILITLTYDRYGNIVNRVFDNDSRHRMEHFVVCVFPLEDSTIVMMFDDKANKVNRGFINNFIKETVEEKLKILSYLIVRFSEDYVLSPLIDKTLLENPNVKYAAQSLDLVLADSPQKLKESGLRGFWDGFEEFPNFFDIKYAIK